MRSRVLIFACACGLMASGQTLNRKVNLPAEVDETTTRKAADELVKKVMSCLTKENPKVKAFVAEAAK